MHFLRRVFLALLALCAIGALTGCGQTARQFIFTPENAPIVATEWSNVPAYSVRYRTPDGLGLLGWYWPGTRSGFPLITHLHGSTGHMGVAALYLRDLIEQGYPVFIPDYRGYGPNPGVPNSRNLLLDARGILDASRQLAARNHPAGIVLFAHSLGNALAIDMAHQEAELAPFPGSTASIKALVLVAPFTQVSQAAPTWARPFIQDDFDNLTKVSRIHLPTVIIHGRNDRVVPLEHGARIFEFSRRNAAFVVLENAGHRPSPQTLIALTLAAVKSAMANDHWQSLRRQAAQLPQATLYFKRPSF